MKSSKQIIPGTTLTLFKIDKSASSTMTNLYQTISKLSMFTPEPAPKPSYFEGKWAALKEINSQFFSDMCNSSKIDNSNYSSIPSVIFLFCTFTILFLQIHRCTSSYTKWSTRLYRDLIFHWAFFYATRMWFLFVKLCRWSVQMMDFYVQTYSPEEEVYLNQIMSHICVFLIVLSIALIPFMMLTMRQLYSRTIPNFLMWVGEDPWVRSEIGTSGHYLERPPTLPAYANKNMAFRSRRSTSVESNIYEQKPQKYLRQVRSMQIITRRY